MMEMYPLGAILNELFLKAKDLPSWVNAYHNQVSKTRAGNGSDLPLRRKPRPRLPAVRKSEKWNPLDDRPTSRLRRQDTLASSSSELNAGVAL